MTRGNHASADARDTSPAILAAELTDAAYAVALRHGVRGSWIDLQMALWGALVQVVERAEPPSAGCPDEIEAWREGLLADLIAASCRAALSHGLQRPFLEVVSDLSQALRPLVARIKGSTP